MKQLFIIILFITPAILFAQAPFASKTKFKDYTVEEYRKRAKKQDLDKVVFKNVTTDVDINKNSASDNKTIAATAYYNNKMREAEERADVLDQFSGGLNIPTEEVAQLFPTINGDIITYRLRMWTTVKNNVSTRHYLPFAIISKVSGSQKNNTGTINDAVSFFGAPLTFRLTPTFVDVPLGDTRFVFGMHHDLRILAIGDTLTDKLQAGFGYYGAIGLSIFGEGDVSTTGDPTKYEGTWSFSALLYHFSSGGKFDKAVFGNYEPKSLHGFEFLLRFKTSKEENSKFNLLLGANYGITKNAPNHNKWDFKIGIGN